MGRSMSMFDKTTAMTNTFQRRENGNNPMTTKAQQQRISYSNDHSDPLIVLGTGLLTNTAGET